MANVRERMRAPWGDVAPRLAEITDTVLFGEVWRRKGLSRRDRSADVAEGYRAMDERRAIKVLLRV